MKKHTNSLQFVPATVLADFYKITHDELYPDNTTKIYSTFTPRSFEYFPTKTDYAVAFGYQMFIKKTLINYFNEHFFSRRVEDVVEEFEYVIENTLGGVAKSDKIRALHKLGYLPLKIKALPEGTKVPVKVPVLTIENTLPEFFWLTNYIESIMSSELWLPSTSATTASHFRRIFDAWAIETTGSTAGVDFQGHDFSLRGMQGLESAVSSGMGHLLSFIGTDNIPSAVGVEMYYNQKLSDELIATSVKATEHSIMSSHGRDEYTAYKTLMKKVPTGILSVVSDTYDYFGVLTDILPKLKEEILSRDGKLVIRPDCYDEETQLLTNKGWKFFKDLNKQDLVAQVLDDGTYEFVSPLKYVNEEYEGDMYHFTDFHGKVDLMVTPNHRMITEITSLKTKEVKEKVVLAEDLKVNNYLRSMRRSASAKSYGKKLTPLERIKIAFQADGSYCTNSRGIRFSFAKERKMNRLESLCREANIDYVKYKLNTGQSEYRLKTDEILFQKDFNWVDISILDGDWCREFIEELSYWDSTRRSNERFKFDTTIKEVMDVVEIIGVSSGYGITRTYTDDNRKDIFKPVHTLHIMKDNISGGQSWKKEKLDYRGNIYCVQVPTGRLLVKRNRGIMVCGNSGIPIDILCGNEKIKDKTSPESKGSLQLLWETFGGTINDQGYKVLDSHVGVLQGDAVTLKNVGSILRKLEENGFASTNLVVGIGAFSMAYMTRDSLGMALKATYAIIDGEEKFIEKDPKTDLNNLKKSLTGKVAVVNENGKLKSIDHLTSEDEKNIEGNLLQTIFKDGKTYNEQTFSEIKNRLYKGE